MEDEAALCTPRPCRRDCDSSVTHSIDIWPRRARSLGASSRGFVGSALTGGEELFCACTICGPAGREDGPDILLGQICNYGAVARSFAVADLEADFNFSGPRRVVAAPHGPELGGLAGSCFPSGTEPLSLQEPDAVEEVITSPWRDSSTDVDDQWPWADAAAPVGAKAPTPTSAADFVSSFKKPIQQPLILTTPLLRRTRSRALTDEELIPKRSARLAAKSMHREAKPEAQAHKVMMKRIGLQVETERPDEASFDEFHVAFKAPLSNDTRETMEVLFPGRKQRTLWSVCAA